MHCNATYKVPILRFPEFQDIWNNEVLKRVAIINPYTGKLPNSFVYIDLESVKNGILIKENRITNQNSPSRAQRVLSSGDIIFQTVRPYQSNNFLFHKEGSYVASTGYAQIKSKINASFLYYYLHTQKFLKTVIRWSTGSNYPAIAPTDLGKIPIDFPTLNEQQKIASFLSAVDKKIELLTRKKELLEQYKKGVMQKIFSQEIRFRDEDGKDFPDWEERSLHEITIPIKRTTDKIISDVLTISAGRGFISQKERFNQVIAGSSLDKYTMLKRNEFSYNRGNSKTYTYGCIYRLRNHSEALVPNVYRSFQLMHGDYKYMEQLFISKYLDRQLRRLISSTARMDGLLNIGQEDFYKCKVPFPSIEEQKVTGNFFETIDKKIMLVDNQLDSNKFFKKGLLQQMFV